MKRPITTVPACVALLAAGLGVHSVHATEQSATTATAAAPAKVVTAPEPATAPSPPAAVLPAVNVRGGLHASYDRIVFDWPQRTPYKITQTDNQISISFERAADFNLRQLTSAKLERSGSFAQRNSNDTTIFTFTVAADAKIQDFLSGSFIVLDISSKTKLADAGKPAPVSSANEKPETTKPTIPPATSEVAIKPATPTTSANVPAPTPAPAATPVNPVATEATPTASINSTAETTTPTAPTPATAPEAMSAEAKAAAELATETARIEGDENYNFTMPELGDQPVAIANVDIGVSIAIAVYQRAGFVYIILDRKLPEAQEDLLANQQQLRLQKLKLASASGFRFPLSDAIDVRVAQQGTAWQILLAKTRRNLPVTLTLVADPDYALGARLVLPVTNAAPPVRFNDPVVGDPIIVVPLGRPGEMLTISRSFADLDVLPTIQGMLLRPINETVVARQVPDGIEITAKGGLQMSPFTDTGARTRGAEQIAVGKAPKLRLFDINGWQGRPGETYTRARQRLMQTVTDVPEIERDRARLQLARLYFANGFAAESLSMLKMLGDRLPDLAARPEFIALRGANRVLRGDLADGLKDLSSPELATEQEIPLWQAYALAQQRDFNSAYPKFASSLQILEQYPEPFFTKMVVLALETALAQGKLREAYDWLERWQLREDVQLNDLPAIKYLRGVMEHEFEHEDKARTLWEDVARSSDRLYRTRAELALIDLDVAESKMGPLDAAKRLEGLRYGWRGDELEVDILGRLGGYYIVGNKYKDGLTTLGNAIHLYPKSPQVIPLHDKMVNSFRAVFLENAAPDLSPIEALALYQQFRDLIPTGDDGEAVVRNLAERLVSIDLLDQAADLLTAQIKNKPPGEAPARVAARLAGIRLLDKKPELALTALDSTDTTGLSQALLDERRYLRARALSELRRDQDALQVLANDQTEQGRMLHADIAWRAQRWGEAAQVLESLIGAPPPTGVQLQPDIISLIINRATALALASDQPGLDRLAIDFSAAMSSTPQADTFRLLTRTKSTNIKDLAVLQSKMGEVDMFKNFLNQYRTQDQAPMAEPAAPNSAESPTESTAAPAAP